MRWALDMYPLQLRPTLETQANYTVEWLELASTVGMDRFSQALVEAVRDSDYFPVISQIRRHAGMGSKQQVTGESSAAWLWLEKYIQKWPLYEYYDGIRTLTDGAPEIPPRIAHAVRLCGGLMRIQNASERDLAFIKRDFLSAFEGYVESSAAFAGMFLEHPTIPVKELKAPQDNFADRLLKQLTDSKSMEDAKPIEKSLDLDRNREALEQQKKSLLAASSNANANPNRKEIPETTGKFQN